MFRDPSFAENSQEDKLINTDEWKNANGLREERVSLLPIFGFALYSGRPPSERSQDRRYADDGSNDLSALPRQVEIPVYETDNAEPAARQKFMRSTGSLLTDKNDAWNQNFFRTSKILSMAVSTVSIFGVALSKRKRETPK